MKLHGYLVPLLVLLASCRGPEQKNRPESVSPSQPTANAIVAGRCTSIVPTGKRHESFIFTIDVASVRQGKFESAELGFELYHDGGGRDLLTALSVQRTSNRDNPITFDKTKVLIVTINPISEPYTLREVRVNAKVTKWRIEARK